MDSKFGSCLTTVGFRWSAGSIDMDSTPDTVGIWMAATFDKMNRCERLFPGLIDGTRALYLHFDDFFTCLLCLECHEVQRFDHFRDVEVKDTCLPPLTVCDGV